MLSVLIVCRQIDEHLAKTIDSVQGLSPQVLVDISPYGKVPLGVRKNRLINCAAHEWVLVLDTDEVASPELVQEIRNIMNHPPKDIHGYEIPYQNYIFGKPVYFGGERYFRKQLFRKEYGSFTPVPIHEHPEIVGKTGTLKGVIHHYSYTNLLIVFAKFTKYAWQMAGEKYKAREKVTLKKLFLYGPHMVWARVIKDEGWRDGWRGILIALCFGYMENLMYWLLLYRYIMGVSTINEP